MCRLPQVVALSSVFCELRVWAGLTGRFSESASGSRQRRAGSPGIEAFVSGRPAVLP